MVHLATMLHRTPSKIHRNSQNCRARITTSTMNADQRGSFVFIKGVGTDPTTTKRNYSMVVKLYVDPKTGKPPQNPKVFAWCSCDWFKYNAEVALAIRGSSYIVNSNGALPKLTNPNGRPQVCKHCLAFFRTIRSQPMKIQTKIKESKVNDERSDAKLQTNMDNNRGKRLTVAQRRQNADALGSPDQGTKTKRL